MTASIFFWKTTHFEHCTIRLFYKNKFDEMRCDNNFHRQPVVSFEKKTRLVVKIVGSCHCIAVFYLQVQPIPPSVTFSKLFQSSKLKARTSRCTETWQKRVRALSYEEIPAKKWGDTEIAERGRSVLVMRASYRSAELTPHQCGWTDAG